MFGLLPRARSAVERDRIDAERSGYLKNVEAPRDRPRDHQDARPTPGSVREDRGLHLVARGLRCEALPPDRTGLIRPPGLAATPWSVPQKASRRRPHSRPRSGSNRALQKHGRGRQQIRWDTTHHRNKWPRAPRYPQKREEPPQSADQGGRCRKYPKYPRTHQYLPPKY